MGNQLKESHCLGNCDVNIPWEPIHNDMMRIVYVIPILAAVLELVTSNTTSNTIDT